MIGPDEQVWNLIVVLAVFGLVCAVGVVGYGVYRLAQFVLFGFEWGGLL